MLVRYDSKTDNFQGIFSLFGKLKEAKVSETLTKTFQEMNDKGVNPLERNIKRLCKTYDITDESAINFLNSIHDGSIQLKDGQTMLQGYQAYLQSTSKSLTLADIGTKALSASMKVFSTIGWTVLFAGISWAIGKAVEGIDHLINHEKYAQKALENALETSQKFKDSISNTREELSKTKKSVSEIASEYAKLSQGVNVYTNENISLTNEQYEEFVSLNNQVAELFPSLTRNYDENGNAILGLGGSVESVTDKIQTLIEQQERLATIEMRKSLEGYVNGDEDGNGGQIEVLKGFEDNLEKAENELNKFKEKYDAVFNGKQVGEDFLNGNQLEKAKDYYKNAFGLTEEELKKSTVIERNFLGEGVYRLDFKNLKIDESRKEEILEFYNSFYKELNNDILYAQSELDTANKEMSSMMMLWVEDESLYKDGGNTFQTLIQSMIGDIDWNQLGIENYDDAKTWIKDNIFRPISSVDGDDKNILTDALGNLISLDSNNLPIGETKEKIDKFLAVIAEILGQESADKLKVSLGFDNVDTLINSVRGKLQDSFDDKVGELSLGDLEIAANKLEIDPSIPLSWDELIAKIEEYKASLKEGDKSPIFNNLFSLKDADNNATVLSDLKDQLSEVESAYQTCLSAKEEYEEQGYLSVDTLEKVLSLGDEYLQYLFDEEGNVRLDAEAFQELAQARINNLEAQALSNLAENIKQITDEETATEYLAQKQNDLAISYADVAANALMAMSSIDGFSDSKPLQDTYNRFKSQYEQIKGLFANTRKGLSTTYSSSHKSGAVQTAKDAQQVAKDTQQAAKDYIEAYMDYMEKSLESGRIDYQRYAHDVSNFLKSMYDDGKISAKEYFDYNKQMLEYQKGVMDQVVSAVDRRLEKEIDSYNDQIASVEERYQTEIDYLDTVIQYYEDQKTALQDANDEIDRQLKLEQALYAFEMAQNQRTKKVFTSDSGFVYKADGTAVKDASDDLRDAKLDMEIARLEEAIQQVEEQQKALQDAMNAETAALEDIISNLEAYRDKWNEIAKEYEIAQDDIMAAQLLGADWESQIIDGRLETLNKFRDNYLAIQQSIVDAAWKSANEQIEAARQAELKSQGQKGSGVIQTASTTSTAPANPAYWVYRTLGSYNTKGEASGKIGMLNGDEVIHVGGRYLVVKWKNGYKSSGEASSKIVSNNGSGVYKRYHTGLKEGLVGKNSLDDDFSMVQQFGLKKYEVPAILKEKEAVLTEVQIGNLADALRFLPPNNIMPNVHVPDYSSLMSPVTKNTEQAVVQNINVTLPNITNEAGFNNFKREMDRLRLDAYQYAHRRHK